MATTSTVNHQDRIVLLRQAIDLCQSLASVLQVLGPKQSSDVLQQDEPSSRQQQIHTMEDTLDRAFRAVIEARNRVLAPVSRITDDVLRLLFLHSQSDEASSLDPSLPGFFRMWKRSGHPYNMSSVCRRWRNVALESAPLWSCLYLKAPAQLMRVEEERKHPRFRNREAVIRKRTHLSLLRSRESLLTIELDIWGSMSVPELLQYFSVSFTNRVKDLGISVNDYPALMDRSKTLQVYSHCIQSTSATLTRVTLGRVPSPGPNPEDHEQNLNSLFSTKLPRLYEAQFTGIPFPNPPHFAILASCRVLTMHCSPGEGFSWQCCAALFTTCEQLEDITLVLGLYDGSIDSGYLNARICMPHLHSFSITYDHCHAELAFPLPMLRLPNLRSLNISRPTILLQPQPAGGNLTVGPAPDASPMDPLTSALVDVAQNTASLRSFSVENIPPDVLRQVLPHLSSVLNFGLVYGAYDPTQMHEMYVEVIALLVQGHGSPASFTLPDLETLDLGCSASMENLFFLHDFLAKRKDAGLPIHALRLSGFSGRPSLRNTQPSLEEACAIEEKVASVVDVFSITEGNWLFDKREGAWKQQGSDGGLGKRRGRARW